MLVHRGRLKRFSSGSEIALRAGRFGVSPAPVHYHLCKLCPCYVKQDLCKLEIVRQDKKSDWYEVRSSMRLVWLKARQEIVPVEVICSFQQMHCDGPAGSANSIVARLQRVSQRERRVAFDVTMLVYCCCWVHHARIRCGDPAAFGRYCHITVAIVYGR